MRLANLLLGAAQRDRGLRPMLAARADGEDAGAGTHADADAGTGGASARTPGSLPLLFTHEPTSRNSGATDAAARVAALVASFFDADASLRPSDVSIVMAKINNSAVMGALESLLEEEFERRFGGAPAAADAGPAAAGAPAVAPSAKKRGARRFVTLFATEADAARIAIKWSRAKGKASLSSVHAIKGRSARLVVFLGVSEGAIPREARVHRHAELVDLSILNVGLTRSTQYLAVGFAARRPSRYLFAHREDLRRVALPTWPEPGPGPGPDAGAEQGPPACAPDAVERAVLAGYAARLTALQLSTFARPDWSYAASTYLASESGRPEFLVFAARLLADRQQAQVDGDAAFDPAGFSRRLLPGAQPVAFPAAVDADDDLVACVMGVLGELALQITMAAPNVALLSEVLRALRDGAAEAADGGGGGGSGGSGGSGGAAD